MPPTLSRPDAPLEIDALLDLRLFVRKDRPPADDRAFVLYWMTAARRPTHNFALQRAAHWARRLGKPLVVFEPLRIGYRWASARHHRFILDGMHDNRRLFADLPVTYHPYVEPEDGAGKGLLAALSAHAAVVVGDESPMFFYPRMLAAAEAQIDARFETVDGNGLLPLRAAPRAYPRAFSFRRAIQKHLFPHFEAWPEADPLAGLDLPALDGLPAHIVERWPPAGALDRAAALERRLPIDQSVPPVEAVGGPTAGAARLTHFVTTLLDRYGHDRNQPTRDGTSRLSSYLHYGHVAAHQIFDAVADHEGWTPARVSLQVTGKREGWWGMSPAGESFMDELVTWRELGYQYAYAADEYRTFDSLPDWARETLARHRGDPRPDVYTRAQFEDAETHDPLWNAAQNQLRREGVIHNYLRMLWGKKILHWSRTPEEALDIMIELNNRWAIDGRDPNAYSGIFWVLGRFDRAWGPERPIFGKIRYMTSKSTRSKYTVGPYIEAYGGSGPSQPSLGETA